MNRKILGVLICTIIIPLASVAQVPKYAKLDIVDKEKFNYPDNTNPKVESDYDLKVVFSDRTENQAFNDPYSQETLEKQGLLSSYYVIGRKNDSYQLIAFEEGITGRPKGLWGKFMKSKYRLEDSKSVNYIGWISKDKLLHYNHSFLSPENNRPLKYKVGISKFSRLYNLDKFFHKDTVFVYEDPFFKRKSAKNVSIYQTVYPYKYDPEKKAVLISDKPTLADDADQQIVGWIPVDLISPIGQNQVIKVQDEHPFPLTTDKNNTLEVSPYLIRNNMLFATEANVPQTTGFNTDSITVPLYVWDRTKSKLINIWGNDIYTSEIFRMERENRHTNFHLIFSDQDRTDIGKLINSFQKIGLGLKTKKGSNERYTFSASSLSQNSAYFLPPTSSFAQWLDGVQQMVDNSSSLQPIYHLSLQESIYRILNEYDKDVNFENNVFILIGSRQNLKLEDELIELMAEKSSKLLIVQSSNSADHDHQDFLLQSKDLLNKLANAYHEFIKNYLVDNSLVVKEASLENIAYEEDKLYVYNAPKKSLFNGGLVFPNINRSISSSSLNVSIDSILSKSHATTEELINSLISYEEKLGLLRSEPSNVLDSIYQYSSLANSKPLSQIDRNGVSDVFYTTQLTPDSTSQEYFDKGLLLNKDELNELIDNYRILLPYFSDEFNRKQRIHLEHAYRDQAKAINKSFKHKVLSKKSTLSQLYYYKTGMPSHGTQLDDIKIKRLSRRKLVEGGFDAFYQDLRSKPAKLEELFLNNQLETVDSPAEEYYFIPFELLL